MVQERTSGELRNDATKRKTELGPTTQTTGSGLSLAQKQASERSDIAQRRSDEVCFFDLLEDTYTPVVPFTLAQRSEANAYLLREQHAKGKLVWLCRELVRNSTFVGVDPLVIHAILDEHNLVSEIFGI